MRFELRNKDGAHEILLDGIDVSHYVARGGVHLEIGPEAGMTCVTLRLVPTKDVLVDVDALIELARSDPR